MIITGKAPRPEALPQRNGVGFGDEWLPRGSRVGPSRGGLGGFGSQGAEPMSSSLAGPDCCGGLGNIDFRQVMIWLGHVGIGREILMTTGPAGTASNAWWAGLLLPGNGAWRGVGARALA